MDKIKVYRKCGKKYDYHYRHSCKECKKDRGYLPHKIVPDLCRSCAGKISHLNPSEETRAKMSNSKKGRVPPNKGIPTSDEVKQKISDSRKGSATWNKGIPVTEEQKIKIACTLQGIETEDFEEFKTPLNRYERNLFSDSGLKEECLKKANYTCDITGKKGGILNVHHLANWADNEELRFDINNLVCLSKEAHDTFHNKYGRKNNTKEQYEEFKKLGLA